MQMESDLAPAPAAFVLTVSGRPDGGGLADGIDRAYREGRLRPRQSRVIVLSACHRGDVSVDELRQLKALELFHEGRDAGAAPCYAFFLAENDRMAVLADIYMTLCELGPRPAIHHRLVRTREALNAAASECGIRLS